MGSIKWITTLQAINSLAQLELVHQGKVRDVYALDRRYYLMVASDRLSAFDVILPDPIPGKGEILTQLSNFWFEQTGKLVSNHLSGHKLGEHFTQALTTQLQRRAVIVQRLRPLPVEAIVRGYLIGSGWKDYQASGSLCGIKLPAGLQQAEQLPEPLFTPSSKAAQGDHDENISVVEMADKIGKPLAEQVQQVSLELYRFAAELALRKGIIIADTKFEFGLDEQDKLVLMDEIFTPDSSRFWPQDKYQPGSSPPSFDKQFVRDHLETLDWDKTSPGPHLPQAIIEATGQRYQSAYEILTGKPWQR